MWHYPFQKWFYAPKHRRLQALKRVSGNALGSAEQVHPVIPGLLKAEPGIQAF